MNALYTKNYSITLYLIIFCTIVQTLFIVSREKDEPTISAMSIILLLSIMCLIFLLNMRLKRQVDLKTSSLIHLNRKLRAITDCHQALIRAVDERTLLNDVCKIVCEIAGYRMAWVGYVEYNENKTVRPIVWQGIEDGYLANAKITWDDTESGRGPAGICIRSGKSCYVNNILTSENMKPWHKEALKRGYKSALAMPLKDKQQKAFGTLLVYSSETDAFMDEEIKLLEGLSDDLSFGIIALRDRAEHKKAEESLIKLSKAIEQNPVGIIITDTLGKIEFVNPKFSELTGYTYAESIGQNLFLKLEELSPNQYKEIWKSISEEKIWDGELVASKKDGSSLSEHVIVSPIFNKDGIVTNYMVAKEDISIQKSLKEQLLQSQKMEAIGKLAGGVAHDYNNMLSVIIGHAETAMEDLQRSDPLYPSFEEILKAAQRSADLTRQLLTFARKQIISPKVLDLKETVEKGILKMIKRLIGEDITLEWIPAKNLWPIKIDPVQIDQILANLCINARDAINGVGKIIIEIQNITLDYTYCEHHAKAISGDYVLLTVTDDGCGMDEEIKKHLFEPFFTTKEVGKGTGLGLATIYGIINQNNGFISVYSEPGHGTAFKIYWPKYMQDQHITQPETSTETITHGKETIFMVEDEQAILKLGKTVLENLGYQVLTANSPREAINIAKQYTNKIQLLITDIVMPEMNGLNLAEQLVLLHPELKCIFMSGYTSNVIEHHGLLDQGVDFIAKPFSMKDLAIKVRQVLNRNSQIGEHIGSPLKKTDLKSI